MCEAWLFFAHFHTDESCDGATHSYTASLHKKAYTTLAAMKALEDIRIVFMGTPEFAVASLDAVSYTHLDVYKRQV